MVTLFYTNILSLYNSEKWDSYFNQIPKQEQDTILENIRIKEKLQKLGGRLLLMHVMSMHTNLTLNDISYTPLGKPYIHNAFQFSIAHSGEYVVLAMGDHFPIGVDIEIIKDIEPTKYYSLLNQHEINELEKTNSSLTLFYTYWVIKESISKATGLGLNFNFKEIKIISEKEALIGTKQWYLEKVEIEKNYICFISTPEKMTNLIVQRIHL